VIALRRYIIDTNCYIDAANNPEFAEALVAFASRVAPGLHASAVVIAELEAGLPAARDRAVLEREFTWLYTAARRIVTPSEAAWRKLGEVLNALRADSGLKPYRVRRAFAFDVLLACSCREIGATLVTRDARDFARIADLVGLDLIAPFAT
jgi:predicted nucleic acid-binding protein